MLGCYIAILAFSYLVQLVNKLSDLDCANEEPFIRLISKPNPKRNKIRIDIFLLNIENLHTGAAPHPTQLKQNGSGV
jgi:hypothetical protein